MCVSIRARGQSKQRTGAKERQRARLRGAHLHRAKETRDRRQLSRFAGCHASCSTGLVPQTPLIPDDDARLVAAKAKVGTTLRGKWHLDSLIALGGMSAVYQGTHRNGMRGAVKILDAHLGASIASAARKRFLREGRLANRVNHPGAVRVLDDDETADGAYLVMEL